MKTTKKNCEFRKYYYQSICTYHHLYVLHVLMYTYVLMYYICAFNFIYPLQGEMCSFVYLF